MDHYHNFNPLPVKLFRPEKEKPPAKSLLDQVLENTVNTVVTVPAGWELLKKGNKRQIKVIVNQLNYKKYHVFMIIDMVTGDVNTAYEIEVLGKSKFLREFKPAIGCGTGGASAFCETEDAVLIKVEL